MTMSISRADREYAKFVEDENGNTAVRVEGSLVIEAGSIADRILSASDKSSVVTTADFGTIKERVTVITWTAPSVGPEVLTRTLAYTLIAGKYRYDGDTWSVA